MLVGARAAVQLVDQLLCGRGDERVRKLHRLPVHGNEIAKASLDTALRLEK